MELSLTVLTQVVIMFILIILGYILVKVGKITKTGADQMSNGLLLTVVTPCVIIKAYQIDFTKELAVGITMAFILSIISHLIGMLVAKLAFKKQTDGGKYKIERFCTVYSNCGFMAIPILDAVLGGEGVFYGSAYLVAFNLLGWTLGIYSYTEDKKSLSLKNVFLNPGVVGVLLGVFLFITQIKLPDVVNSGVNYMAALNTPVAMIVIGAFLSKVNIKKAITNKSLYKVSFLRLIFIPIVAAVLFKLSPISDLVATSIIITAACPAAALAALFASKYDLDSGYASEIVALTTIFSVITIPLIVLISEFI